MSLPPGTRFGAHEISARIGAGGMGEVYRARDAVLHREVALKVLPDEFVRDPDRLTRFEREARTLAALNHPNIAQIYGVERANGLRAIVMELVDGESLAARLSRGAMAMDEALPVARQIAEALETAHASGIVHRDLKPGNIMLRHDGGVKVLDFGLAKLASADAPSSGAVLMNSPTMTSPANTQAGIILGTAAYMAPEQAKGRAVDRRADVWAFGCVLYEILTGQCLFAGADISETLAAVLRKDPDWATLPPETPESVRRLLRRCLVRDPRQRLPDIGVARLEIDDAIAELESPPARARRTPLWPAAIAAAGVAVIALAAFAAVRWRDTQSTVDATARVLQIASGDSVAAPQLAPNGRAVVFTRNERIVVRSLETGDERELPDTEGALHPFWSPDATQIGFFSNREFGWELRVTGASGGASRVIVKSSLRAGDRGRPSPLAAAAWCAAGIVYFEGEGDVMRLANPVQGQILATFQGEGRNRRFAYPHCLSDGRILAVLRGGASSSLVVATPAGHTTLVEMTASIPVSVRFPVLVGSSHIVFERSEPDAGLWIVPVAPDLSRATGPERLLIADARRPSVAGNQLAYLSGVRSGDRELVWVDRSGKRLETFGRPQREFRTPTLSPDATQVITGGRRVDANQLWLHRQDTVQSWIDARGSWPAWSPDNRHIAYVSGPVEELVVRSIDGTSPRVVAKGQRFVGPAWTPDSASLVYVQTAATNDEGTPRNPTVWLAGISASDPPRQILDDAREPAVSPNGDLIAFASNSTGRSEVYVTTFPNPAQAAAISIDGGRYPRWTSSGKELFFACGPTAGEGPGAHRALCVAAMEPGKAARRGAAVRLFDAAARGLILITYGERGYDVARDGSRILLQTGGAAGTPAITLIQNVDSWLASRAAQ